MMETEEDGASSPRTAAERTSIAIFKRDRVIHDREAEAHGDLRVVDESGDNDGRVANRFFAIDLPTLWRAR
jgi:hypothetical protein